MKVCSTRSKATFRGRGSAGSGPLVAAPVCGCTGSPPFLACSRGTPGQHLQLLQRGGQLQDAAEHGGRLQPRRQRPLAVAVDPDGSRQPRLQRPVDVGNQAVPHMHRLLRQAAHQAASPAHQRQRRRRKRGASACIQAGKLSCTITTNMQRAGTGAAAVCPTGCQWLCLAGRLTCGRWRGGAFRSRSPPPPPRRPPACAGRGGPPGTPPACAAAPCGVR